MAFMRTAVGGKYAMQAVRQGATATRALFVGRPVQLGSKVALRDLQFVGCLRSELHNCRQFRQHTLAGRRLRVSNAVQEPHLASDVRSGTSQLDWSRGLATSTESGEASPSHTVLLDVGGMKCGGCSAAVKRILLASGTADAAAVNLVTETAAVTFSAASEGEASTVGDTLAALLTTKGFPSHLRREDTALQDEAERAEERRKELQRSNVDLAVAWSLALLCCTHHLGHWMHSMGWHTFAHTSFMAAMAGPRVSAALGAFSLLGPGRKIVTDGALSLYRGNPNMNSLIGMGAVTSFTVGALSPLLPRMGFDPSFMEEPVMLLAFVLVGRALETRARLKAAADLRLLARLIPARTRVVLDASPTDAETSDLDVALVSTAAVRAGDLVRVLPGERFPVDGQLLDGSCSADESMLTGESLLVPKRPGDQVTAGTVAYEAPVTLRATSTGSGSTLAGIGRLVAEAQSREAPVQRVADAISGKFCYGIMAISAATFNFWSLLGANMFPQALELVGGAGDVGAVGAPVLLAVRLAVDVLVVACPCALGLATPTAVLVATSLGAKQGLLIRGGDVLERIAQVDTVVLDKTGTLTEGRLRLTSAQPGPGTDRETLLRVAAAVESSTRHPLADAVLAAAREAGLQLGSTTDARTTPGEGAAAVVDGYRAAVGRAEWVREQVSASSLGVSGSEAGGQAGQTLVHVAMEGRGFLGTLAFSDTLRPDSHAVVQKLKDMGMEIVVLSGDSPGATAEVARQLGLPPGSARGGARPADKAAEVQRLRREGRVVAMVGDGVNDAPALAAADVGIAMGGGLDAAGEAASVVLMGDRLGQVVEAVTLGRSTLSKIRQNLGWALLYNVLGVPIAAGVLIPAYSIALSPSSAGGMMAISSLAVVSNSLLLAAQWRARAPALQKSLGSGRREDAEGAPASAPALGRA